MSQDFQNGKIYKITNNINSEVYVGSTCDILRKRFNNHASYSKQDDKLNRPLYKMMNELGPDIFRIDLIENYSCNDKQELRQREGYWIRQIGTLNKVIAGRTKQEYNEENKDKIKETVKKYHVVNKEKLKQYDKKYYEDNKEKLKEYRQENKERFKETSKKYYEENIEKIKERKCIIISCECGACISKSNISIHKKSKKHLAFLENNTTN